MDRTQAAAVAVAARQEVACSLCIHPHMVRKDAIGGLAGNQ